jgi:hypothetical protein
MGFFNNVFRKHFVSHQEKFIEQHGHFCAQFLNHIDDLDFQKFQSGVIANLNDFPSNSPLVFLNGSKLNVPELLKSLAVWFVIDNLLEIEGLPFDEMEDKLVDMIQQSIQLDTDKNTIRSAIRELSKRYKKFTIDDRKLSNINCLYIDSFDVETPEFLDGVFNSFYLIQGYFLCISTYSMEQFNKLNEYSKHSASKLIFKEVIDFKDNSPFINVEKITKLMGVIYQAELILSPSPSS